MLKKLFLLTILLSLFTAAGCDDDDSNNSNNTNNTNNTNTNNVNEPVITSIIPSRGPLAGGTEVFVYGRNFTDDASIFFGTVEATQVTFQSSGTLRVVTPAATSAGLVDIRIEQSSGDFTLSGGFTYDENSQTVDIAWCIFQAPATTTTTAGTSTELLYGRVYADGVTNQPGKGNGVTAQVGYGPAGTNPETVEWTWVSANFNMDVDDGVNDEYMSAITPVLPGTYDMAFRFSGGASFVYCDLDGSDNGFSSEHAASLVVTEQTEPVVGWCNIQFPTSYEATTGAAGPSIYGQVYMETVTDAAGQGGQITAELGYGPVGTIPGVDPGWQFAPGTYNADSTSGANDEYAATLLISQPGDYHYAWRFAYNNGPWLYCDSNGSDDGYSPEQAGHATISGESTASIDWCNIQYPAATAALAGEDTSVFYGRVYSAGITNGNGQGQGIMGMIGYGPEGSDPDVSTEWIWSGASYNVSVDGAVSGDLSNDEYMASLNIAEAGLYSVAFRFSADGGNTWTMCDLDGSENGIDTAQLSELEIYEQIPVSVDWCTFQYPSSVEMYAGATSEALFGRVFAAGSTEGAGQGGGITGQVGFGPDGTDPSVSPGSYTWEDALYNVSVDGLIPGDQANDEYMAMVTGPAAGTYSLAYRFSRDNGLSWTYCDLDGSSNGVDTAQLPSLTVTDPPPFEIYSISPAYGPIAGGTLITINGTGFDATAAVTIGGQVCTNLTLVDSENITCTTPAGADFGYENLILTVGWGFTEVVDGFGYRPIFTPALDGAVSEWPSSSEFATNTVTTDWTGNTLTSMSVSYDATFLYIAVSGSVEAQNGLIIFIDTDYGFATGVNDMSDLHDNNGNLDNAISGVLTISEATFGAEFAAGSIGNGTVTADLNDAAGLRNLSNQGNFGWDGSTVLWDGNTSVEIAIPLATLNLTTPLTTLGLVAVITSNSGDALSNQSLPEGINAGDIASVVSVEIQQ
ncbi:IPT/TIG domain-containing protein [Myxococcota bacterium]|nr:IPT/TIG domain-containing protein [Myxococcota bacterium]MBU1382684.1 IPT/TIG domain-containing protein [Myxococcota bacterium]MBU1497707.1 IPT/TIG domain-containing protein [Myxococcota bacterium]